MKKTLLMIALLMIALLSFNSSKSEPKLVTRPVIIMDEVKIDGTIFHNDMKEAILSFADEDTPADSLYMPDFLK